MHVEEPIQGNHETPLRLIVSFWILGLLNNSSYVIMIASAKSISEGGTALVFLANVVPSLTIKASAPYWFEKVSYKVRLQAATLCMVVSFGLVALTTTNAPGHGQDDPSHESTMMNIRLLFQLLGVAFGSAQCGLGEASLLALAGKADGNNNGKCLTSFSSGTGMAGVFGFFWKWFWNDWLGFSLPTTLLLALALAIGYWRTCRNVLERHDVMAPQDPSIGKDSLQVEKQHGNYTHGDKEEISSTPESESLTLTTPTPSHVMAIAEMTSIQRFRLVLSLWPYMIPLFLVYAAEYALQSGTWTAVGFPLESVPARNRFFEYSNWMYQVGVFISRSSGTMFTAPMILLWLMPILQCANLGFYTYLASRPTSPLYQAWVFYLGALYTGLLGGAVYIHGYKRICLDLPLEHREFSLSATSVAEGIGVVVADSVGLFIQSCMYQVNHLAGALVTCPFQS